MRSGDQPRKSGHKGLRHFLIHGLEIAIFVSLGLYVEHHLNEKDYWMGERYSVYQALQSFSPRKPRPQRTVLVLIGDEEYWKGRLAGRVPIKRDYLAELVMRVAESEPALIALDFDLRSPSPDGNPVEAPDFKEETKKLLEAVNVASQQRPIVLPKAITTDEQDQFVSVSDIYRDFKFDKGKVISGYTSLANDTRLVPLLTLHLAGMSLGSFSQAIAEAYDPQVAGNMSDDEPLPYGSFIDTERFRKVTATQVINGDSSAKPALAHKIVIIGGQWHSQAYGTGPEIDSYDSPVGVIPGVFIHANYVEAILDSRLYRGVTGWRLALVEIVFSGIVAVIFLLEIGPFYKLLAVPLIALGLIVFSYLTLMLLALFFDFFIPVFLVIIDGGLRETVYAYKKTLDWRRDAQKWRAQHHGRPTST